MMSAVAMQQTGCQGTAFHLIIYIYIYIYICIYGCGLAMLNITKGLLYIAPEGVHHTLCITKCQQSNLY